MKITLKTILILTILISSCGDDDSITNLPLVETTWTQISSISKDCPDDSDNSEEECSNDCEVMIFNSDGTVLFPNDSESEEITFEYTISGNEMTITAIVGESEVSSSAIYTIVGDILTFTYTNENTGCTRILNYQGT